MCVPIPSWGPAAPTGVTCVQTCAQPAPGPGCCDLLQKCSGTTQSQRKAPASCLHCGCMVSAHHLCDMKVKCTRGNCCRWVCASFGAVLLEKTSMPVLPTAVLSIPRLVAGLGSGCRHWQDCGKLPGRWLWEGATLAGLSQLSCLLSTGFAHLSHMHSQ